MRPRPESVRPRPKIFCEAEAKTYEAVAKCLMNHATYKCTLLSYRISYVVKPTSVKTELT